MAFKLRVRLAGFALAIVLLALMAGWAAHITSSQVHVLSEKFSRVQIESFNISDQFEATLKELDYTLLRFATFKARKDWAVYTNKSDELNRWIDDQKRLLTTPREKETFEKIDRAYDDYLAAATALNQTTSPTAPADALLAALQKVEDQSARLLTLGFELAKAHEVSLEQMLAQSQGSLSMLRRLIFGALLVLLALGAWLAAIVYREMIAPLRMKLVESHAIIERQEKLASLGVLAAGVAHEIRNPLTAIKARLFTQHKRLRSGSPEAEDVQVISGEINRLERIVREVLQFARPAEPQLVPLSTATFLREVRDLLAPQFESNGITLKLEDLPEARVLADPQQLKQVVINLVQNSAESIEGRGRVTLRARVASERLHGHVVPVVILEVGDTGKGIKPEVQKRLFDPFFSTKESGTGLGLAIAARIVEKHGGALEFQTEVNRGTTFGVVLPQIP